MNDEITDRDLIKAMGGPTAVMEIVNAVPRGKKISRHTVPQWRTRNKIPEKFLNRHPELIKAARRLIARKGKCSAT